MLIGAGHRSADAGGQVKRLHSDLEAAPAPVQHLLHQQRLHTCSVTRLMASSVLAEVSPTTSHQF